MSSPLALRKPGAARFRAKLVAAIMLVLLALTAAGFYIAQRHVAAEARHDLQQDFASQLQSLHELQQLRNRALTERCRALVANPRIHAALEDNAIDLLYPSAKDELRDLMQGDEPTNGDASRVLHARFYRFLDNNGHVLPPPNPGDVGYLAPAVESELAVSKLPESQQIGYLATAPGSQTRVDEIVAVPILSTETGEVISALVVGFKPLQLPVGNKSSLTSGIWVNNQVSMAPLSQQAQRLIGLKIGKAIANASDIEGNFRIDIENVPYLLFYNRLNPGSVFPPAYEICVYPLASYESWQRRLRWNIGLTSLGLLVLGLLASHVIAGRLAVPVEKLEIMSEAERSGRERAEAALELTSEELERTARYSADASHQLKSPVTILRSGLEMLLKREDFRPEVYEELSMLLHQTYRLTGVIDDLLLLARMDAGRLKLQSEPVDLGELIDEWLDDLSAMPDTPEIETTKDLPPALHVFGERRYTSLIVQNLLENARKYNRPGGRIEITARKSDGVIVLSIGNTGRTIAPEMQARLFERFQRDTKDQHITGHGLGLNLARELAHLHGGNLRLVRSENGWTQFEVTFRVAVAEERPVIAQVP